MEQINRIVLAGNLTADPELRSTRGGASVCTFRLACNAWAPEPDGERADFFDVTVWGAQGENVARYMEKGRTVVVDGRLKQERWQSGDRSRSRVVIEVGKRGSVQFVGGGGGRGGENVVDEGEEPPDYGGSGDLPDDPAAQVPDFAPLPDGVAPDDDIPF